MESMAFMYFGKEIQSGVVVTGKTGAKVSVNEVLV